MLKKISDKIPFPDWMAQDSRWRWLTIWDKLLDGQFYNHLPHAFYDEKIQGSGEYIKLELRRPSCQYHLPRYIGKWAARKLFAGRHVPKVRCKDKSVEDRVSDLLTGTKIWPTMFEAAFRGSVGSVAVTFRVDDGKIGLKVWRAVWCNPQFDAFGELALLRVHYTTLGADLFTIGIQVEEPTEHYWFIRDYTPNEEITYKPVPVQDWNPVEGFKEKGRNLEPGEVVPHNLGFVPGVWIKNPCGCRDPDGGTLWGDAVPNMIEVDYLLSQAARGSRYSCAPQLVTQGQFKGGGDDGINPATLLAFEAAHKDATGEHVGGGDAKLLEMDGSGAEAALKIVEVLKKFAHEQIGIVQKDPGEMPGPLSGRAMEYLDEDAHDTAMQWRTTYGEGGALPLICKILQVKDPSIDVSKLWLQWPRIYQPTPGDLQAIVQALVMAITPIPVGDPKKNADGTTGEQAVMPPLLDPEIARPYLIANMDLGILDDTQGNDAVGPSGEDPAPSEEEGSVMGENGPFWRLFPPIKVKMRNR